jgi:transmembrane sensor
MEENRLWFLIARHLSGELSDDQSSELQELLRLHPQKQYLVDILHFYFDRSVDSEQKDPDANLVYEEKFHRIVSASEPSKILDAFPAIQARKTHISRIWRFAAAVAGIVSISYLGYVLVQQTHTSSQAQTPKANEVISKSGVRTKIMLPDGTQVWLNSGSKINYSNEFNQRLREVELEGEAFFDVAKNADRPFIVHASSINIKVKGTAFDVKSYPQDPTVETTLLRGIIEVSRKDNPNAPLVILKPNEKLILNKQSDDQTPRHSTNIQGKNPGAMDRDISVTAVSKSIPDSNKVETSWVYNRLVFDGDSFQELAEKMERWYNIKITFGDNELFHYRFKGAFASETIREALDALQLTAKFSYQINNNEIILFKK